MIETAHVRVGAVGGSPLASSRQRFRLPSQTKPPGSDLRSVLRGAVGLADGLRDLGAALRVSRATAPAKLDGSRSLQLQDRSTASRLRSTEAINTNTHQVSDRTPEFLGRSEARLKVDGDYRGGRDDLIVGKVKGRGKRGFRLEIRASRGGPVERFALAADREGPTTLELKNGLSLTIDDGDLSHGDVFSFEVFANVGGIVDPSNPMNGEGADDAVLDPELRVYDGSFELNGTRIRVDAEDSIAEVLHRITSSDAGVYASYDAAGRGVVLQAKEGGAREITLGDDTSGFLAAMKLEGAKTELGETRSAASAPIAEIPGLEKVRSGRIRLNGERIDVNVRQDSIADVFERINASDAGITARMDEDGTAHLEGEGLEGLRLRDPTGLFDALGLSASAVEAGSESTISAKEAAKAVSAIASGLQGIMKASGGAELRSLQKDLGALLAEAGGAEGRDRLRTRFGLRVEFGADGRADIEFGARGKRRFARALRKDPGAVLDFFAKQDGGGYTLMDRIADRLSQARRDLPTGRGTHLAEVA